MLIGGRGDLNILKQKSKAYKYYRVLAKAGENLERQGNDMGSRWTKDHKCFNYKNSRAFKFSTAKKDSFSQ